MPFSAGEVLQRGHALLHTHLAAAGSNCFLFFWALRLGPGFWRTWMPISGMSLSAVLSIHSFN
jgi:hypothetical protein